MTNKKTKPQYKICISGGTRPEGCVKNIIKVSEKIGAEIAKRGHILMTGATIGVPYYAARGAKKEGGLVVGLSPAASEKAHVLKYKLSTEYHDVIIYTGAHYSGRNALLMRSADATITACGGMGTLNEFTTGFELKKPMGVVTGTGGIADNIKEIVKMARRGKGRVVYSDNIVEVIDGLEKMIKKNK